ncbi:carbamate kinase [Pseudonocardia sp. KRD-184]|uniref:Carbamate kinase n=1 Tax=Pseudonocardia oceani TaxID=2792013 RepID=A0ABS6U7Y8_9PSEU|nr:carbamate kinase [Pseudonocardia oceani]MBW0090264.1 carbamate kinase [Pseudonocardia oceani]MBW0097470.1 carbamate kinase [Pseudonocardia oceani]MBW0109705.1 carbamate kinase [Pseudonocardia oceani]MBW0122062.1 carbamate kinase [Pseudonocardia oceani]MBW0128362.1 carbamate kinase [Pseudonocardia oceani]
MPRTVVVALGGNAITRSGETGTHAEQTANARAMARAVCRMREAGWNVVIVHGNGPQVGNLAIQQEEAAHRVPEMPLFWLGAMTEGQLGCLITLALHEAGGGRLPGVVAVVTHMVVDPADPAFARPTKPIGPFLDEETAQRQASERGWTVGEDAGRGYRRLVASPEPGRIVEIDDIRALVDRGSVVVAAGGGGIPVVQDGHVLTGVDAVVDKDLAAEKLASTLGADVLMLVTGVPRVMLDYGTPQAREVGEMTTDEALGHAAAGQFPEGSMGPKMRAATRFVQATGGTAVVTDVEHACSSLEGGPPGAVGTRIVPGGSVTTRIVPPSSVGAAS